MLRAYAKIMQRFLRDESGPTSVEYAVMLALILVVIITSVTVLGSSVNTSLQTTKTALFG